MAAEELCFHRVSALKNRKKKKNRCLLAIPGSSVPACAPVPQLENGRCLFSPLFVAPGYLNCRLRRPRISLLLMCNSCQISAQGAWRPLAANTAQTITGLVVPDNFLSPPFLSSQPKGRVSALQLFVTYRLVLQRLSCLREVEGESARDKSIC